MTTVFLIYFFIQLIILNNMIQ